MTRDLHFPRQDLVDLVPSCVGEEAAGSEKSLVHFHKKFALFFFFLFLKKSKTRPETTAFCSYLSAR